MPRAGLGAWAVVMAGTIVVARTVMVARTTVMPLRLRGSDIMKDLSRNMADIKAVGFCVLHHSSETVGIFAGAVK